MDFQEFATLTGDLMEVAGIVVIVVGTVMSLGIFVARWFPQDTRSAAFKQGRQSIGRSILLGLELLVAGDIIRTVAVEPTFTSLGVLGLVVLIRTFLSFTLELEISGNWPWQKQA